MIKYKLHVLSGVTFKKLSNAIDKINKRSGKNKFLIFMDILNCAVRYGAGYNDYLVFGFYDLNSKQRKTYVTRFTNKKIISALNNDDFSYIFDEKNTFNKRFKEYLKREFLDAKEMTFSDFESFMGNKEVVFVKPNTGTCGKGIERLKKSDFESLQKMFDYIKAPEKDFGVVEEQLIQHKALSKLYPLAINALRIVTLVSNGKANCCYVVSKSGNNGEVVDNLDRGGICCPVDPKTGKIYAVGHSEALESFEKHPYTGVKFEGYKIPYVKEAIELCEKAALEINQIKYVGWDVCITQDGPAIIEGNDYPGYDFWQLPEHTPNKTGILPYFKRFVPGL